MRKITFTATWYSSGKTLFAGSSLSSAAATGEEVGVSAAADVSWVCWSLEADRMESLPALVLVELIALCRRCRPVMPFVLEWAEGSVSASSSVGIEWPKTSCHLRLSTGSSPIHCEMAARFGLLVRLRTGELEVALVCHLTANIVFQGN